MSPRLLKVARATDRDLWHYPFRVGCQDRNAVYRYRWRYRATA